MECHHPHQTHLDGQETMTLVVKVINQSRLEIAAEAEVEGDSPLMMMTMTNPMIQIQEFLKRIPVESDPQTEGDVIGVVAVTILVIPAKTRVDIDDRSELMRQP